ncbi:MAG: bifunctional diaminohydroxyphosphoribosylaminopyrimidine deaminase/5-amino-6-(5-phosphoribosylamino)uracil reductase RibD [Synergistes sp.]|nr:bifunctional diaminohydroxyphosphoribosylaminopyrimidine deaminase/5-amino-6-(5-phosphoribosylamino)uracil reductase RibD [Synergistes sp.]
MTAQNKIDEYYMRCALELAENGKECSPNPKVGCVIVRDGAIIGQGWHEKCGEGHAEVNAVRSAGGDIKDADVYVTLEPCSHYGKTPPCADMLVQKKPSRVIAAMTDPNPKVSGKGLQKLSDAGIKVTNGILKDEAEKINKGFIKRITHGTPWVTVKCAASLDGKTALSNGESKWITCEESLARVHAMRAKNDAILTGIGTVMADDPELNVRRCDGRDPMRVILDRSLRISENAKVLRGGAMIFTSQSADSRKADMLKAKGAIIERITDGSAFLSEVLHRLAEKGVNYLMVEAGSAVTSSFIRENLADEFALFLAPKIIGKGRGICDENEFEKLSCVPKLKDIQYEKSGSDLLIRGVFECSQDL